MKEFSKRQLRAAIAYSMAGGQALHIHNVIASWNKAPECFRAALRRGEPIAHLFDQDYDRLVATAKRFGVAKRRVQRRDTPGQHIDLCGIPLFKAIQFCVNETDYHTMFDQGETHA